MSISKRRIQQILIIAASVGMVFVLSRLCSISLRSTSFFTGWILFFAIVFLALFNVRKKLSFVPLGNATLWLNLHLFVGWTSLFLFGLHLYPTWPESLLGQILLGLFAFVALSGVLGIAISRNFASRLATRGGEVIYERIPILRKQIQEKAEALAMESVLQTETRTIAEFYVRRLNPFFSAPRNFLRHLAEASGPWVRLQDDMRGLERYLDAKELEILTQLRELAREKDTLDYHFALQSALKYWLYLHIPFTFALLLFIVVHIILVHAFIG